MAAGLLSAAMAPMRRTLVLTAVTVALATSAIIAATAGASNPFGPGYRYCGWFPAHGYHVSIYAKRVSCALATAIQREYWFGPTRRKTIVNGGAGASGYILLHRFPGWKCVEGAGSGACTKRQAAAAYQD